MIGQIVESWPLMFEIEGMGIVGSVVFLFALIFAFGAFPGKQDESR